MRTRLLGPVIGLAWLAASMPAASQGQFPTPQGGQQFMAGVVMSCLNSSGNAVPMDSATCAHPVPVTLSGSISGSVTSNQGTAGSSAWPVSVTTWGAGTLGAMANYGTSPGAVLVPGVNAFITNAPSVVSAGVAAAGAAASGNPVLGGCKYVAAGVTLSDGNVGNTVCGPRGQAYAAIIDPTGTFGAAVTNPGDTDGANVTGLVTNARLQNYNGTNNQWQRQFTCDQSAVINVTQGNTTELVALTAAKTIRVCSFAITESLAGTATFVYGTSTNCGSGTTALTGAMVLGTSGTLALSAGNGALFQTASANALCLTAATGNITGFVSYAKF